MIAKLAQDLYAKRPDHTLYHYMSLDGVRGIVDTGSLRATEIRYFSDAVEMKHAGDHLSAGISFFEGFGKSNQTLLDQLREWLSYRLTAGHMLYVGCFTPKMATFLVSGVVIAQPLTFTLKTTPLAK